MKIKIVPIGNSKGIRIPKTLLHQCRIAEAVEAQVQGKRLVLTRVPARPREGWADAAARMHQAGDDTLLIPDVFPDDIEVEW